MVDEIVQELRSSNITDQLCQTIVFNLPGPLSEDLEPILQPLFDTMQPTIPSIDLIKKIRLLIRRASTDPSFPALVNEIRANLNTTKNPHAGLLVPVILKSIPLLRDQRTF